MQEVPYWRLSDTNSAAAAETPKQVKLAEDGTIAWWWHLRRPKSRPKLKPKFRVNPFGLCLNATETGGGRVPKRLNAARNVMA